jgi:dTDP-4-dehydrorhamnose reductase
MKIVVLGATGLVGSHVRSAGLAAGHDVVGTTRSASSPGLRQLELGDQAATLAFLAAEQPEVVIHAAGWTWVDGCEADPERSRLHNFEIPSEVARWCHRHNARFVGYSTSYVFDGSKGGYGETDPVAPVNRYGRDKADAEKAVLDITGGAALVPRLICVWGAELARKNFVYQVLSAAHGDKPLRLPSDQCGNPTWAGDIADWSLCLLQNSAAGIWHLAGARPEMNRVEWAECILKGLAAREPGTRLAIEPQTTKELGQKALRPLLAGMSNAKIQALSPRTCRAPSDIPDDIR